MLDDAPRLGPQSRNQITDPSNDVYVSIVSIWEMALKIRIGKLEADIKGSTRLSCADRAAPVGTTPGAFAATRNIASATAPQGSVRPSADCHCTG
jgi:PIN domain nuclease of toxin-antitoxin system